jgi:thiol-disulfide isomerase/thioredoxin
MCKQLLFVIIIIVIILNCNSIKELFTSPNHTTVYWFYRPGCPYCDDMKDAWGKLENILNRNPKYKLHAINVSQAKNEKLANKYGVQGVPHIVKVQPNGRTSVYDGERSTSDMRKWILKKI